MGLNALTAHELKRLFNDGRAEPRDVLRDIYGRIEKAEGRLGSFTYKRDPDKIFSEASDYGRGSMLSGIPCAIKDNICRKGEPATCASKILDTFKPPYSATCVKKLEDAGALIFGRLNMDEFAFGSSCETSCYGPTRNPWDTTRSPGGSSGGSAASVAADETIIALGSDTGGSIRQPAAFTGVVGMKPTYGRVSRFGLIAFASSLDQIGPITKDVRDCALTLKAISGHDEMDSTSVDKPVPDYTQYLEKDLSGLRAGIPKEYFVSGVDREVEKAVRSSIEIFKELGAEISEVSLPHTRYAVSTYYIIAPAEASSNLARFDGVQYGFRSEDCDNLQQMYVSTRSKGFGEEAKRRIMLGTYVLSSGYYDAYYLRASKVRTKIRNDFKDAFEKCDFLITPTSPTTAFRLGEKSGDPLSMYLADIFTIPANLAGIPAISIPCGFSEAGLPIGMQLMSDAFREDIILKAAYAFEQATDFHKRRCPDITN